MKKQRKPRRKSMTEADIEIILQGAKEKRPEARPRIISDNGPQFIAKDFKEFIRISGMTHVRTSPFRWMYEVSNGLVMARRRKRVSLENVTEVVASLKSLPIVMTVQIFTAFWTCRALRSSTS
jgi:putative transposase